MRNDSIIKFRDQSKAHRIARDLAFHSRRVCGVRPYDSRTYEIFSQADLSIRERNALARIAEAFATAPVIESNRD